VDLSKGILARLSSLLQHILSAGSQGVKLKLMPCNMPEDKYQHGVEPSARLPLKNIDASAEIARNL